jgi:hypothetical protein
LPDLGRARTIQGEERSHGRSRRSRAHEADERGREGRAGRRRDPALSHEETERIAHDLLARAAQHVKDHSPDFNVFKNLGYFVVSAPPAYLKALVDAPEVAHAFPNRREGSATATVEKKK